MALELVLDGEIRELVGAGRFERVGERIDRRNSTYVQRLMTSMGAAEVAVPRTHVGGAAGTEVRDR